MPSVVSRGDKYLARARAAGQSVACSFNDRKTALRWALETEDAMRAGRYNPAAAKPVMTLLQALEQYQRKVSALKKSAIKEAAVIRALASASIASLPLDRVTPAHVAKLRDTLSQGRAAATVVRHLAVLSHVFEVACKDWGIVVENPVRRVRKPVVRNQRDRRYEPGEFEAIIKASDSETLPAVAKLARETAMRLGEVVGLLWINIDTQARTAFLPDSKNGSSRVVPLTGASVAILESLPRKGERVFNVSAGAMSKAWIRARNRARKAYEVQCQRDGIEPDSDWLVGCRFHDTRHTRVSELAERGLNVVELQAVSGHKTLSQLNRYAHVRAAHMVQRLAALEAS